VLQATVACCKLGETICLLLRKFSKVRAGRRRRGPPVPYSSLHCTQFLEFPSQPHQIKKYRFIHSVIYSFTRSLINYVLTYLNRATWPTREIKDISLQQTNRNRRNSVHSKSCTSCTGTNTQSHTVE